MVFKLSRASGSVVARINPFGVPDSPTYVAGGLAADAAGNVYYNAIQLNRNDPWGSDAPGAWWDSTPAVYRHDGTYSILDPDEGQPLRRVPTAPTRGYAIGPKRTLLDRISLDLAVGASYTPVSISSDGLIYAQNNGHLFVVGNPLRPSPVSAGKNRRPRAVGPH
jgi:hypothetical protein